MSATTYHQNSFTGTSVKMNAETLEGTATVIDSTGTATFYALGAFTLDGRTWKVDVINRFSRQTHATIQLGGIEAATISAALDRDFR